MPTDPLSVQNLFTDECDFFRPSDQPDMRHVSERYIAKKQSLIVMVSTTNMPGGLFEQIEREPAIHVFIIEYS
jgi:hypothetical protein